MVFTTCKTTCKQTFTHHETELPLSQATVNSHGLRDPPDSAQQSIEHHAGHFPLWLAPLQVMVATITSEGDDYAMKVRDDLRKAGLRADADLRNEKINYKVREHSLAKVPVILVVGKREMDEQAVNMRRLGSQDQKSMSLVDAVSALVAEATAPDLK